MGIPAVGTIMNFIVLTAVLSCLNSALYTTSRMLFALTKNGDAPKFFTRLSTGGARRAILPGTTVGYVSVICVCLWGDVVFGFLVHSYGAVALFVYRVIAASQVVLRNRLGREDPGTQSQFLMSGVTLIVNLLSFAVRRSFGKRPGDDDDAAAALSETKEPVPGAAGQRNEPHTDSVKIAG